MEDRAEIIRGLDFNKIVEGKDDIDFMLSAFIPPHLHPGQLPGFRDVVLETDKYMKETFYKAKDTDPPVGTVISVIIDVAAWARAVGTTLSEDIIYVIFLRKEQPWAYTFLSLMENIIRLTYSATKGYEAAQSEEWSKAAIREAMAFCSSLFGERFSQFAEVVKRAHANIRNPKNDEED